MTGDANSLVVSTGEVIGEGMPSALNTLDFVMRRGDDGAVDPCAGDWCLACAILLGRTRL